MPIAPRLLLPPRHRAAFAAADVAEPALQPFRYAGDPSQTSTEFKGVIWKDNTRTTLVYAWSITSAVKGEKGKQRKFMFAASRGDVMVVVPPSWRA